jgi:hypothetical protein
LPPSPLLRPLPTPTLPVPRRHYSNVIGMVRVGFSIVTPVDPDAVFNAMIDFSDRRPEFWPALNPGAYEVHELGDTWAEVTEGSEPDVIRWSPFALQRKAKAVWARQRYVWSVTDRTARWTVVESPWIHVPGPAEYRVTPHDHGSRIEYVVAHGGRRQMDHHWGPTGGRATASEWFPLLPVLGARLRRRLLPGGPCPFCATAPLRARATRQRPERLRLACRSSGDALSQPLGPRASHPSLSPSPLRTLLAGLKPEGGSKEGRVRTAWRGYVRPGAARRVAWDRRAATARPEGRYLGLARAWRGTAQAIAG